MLRSSSFLYYSSIFIVSFVCGVAIFHFVELEQARNLIEIVEPRLLQRGSGEWWQFVLSHVVVISVLFLLATHAFLKLLVRIVIAVRITFFGFCSVYLLQELSSIWIYASWWFPFQFVYSMLLLLLTEVLVPIARLKGQTRKFPFRAFVFIVFVIAMVSTIEYAVVDILQK